MGKPRLTDLDMDMRMVLWGRCTDELQLGDTDFDLR
jgi:hypothetical protein